MLFATASSNNSRKTIAAHTELRILLVEDSLRLQSRVADLLTEPGLMRVNTMVESEAQAISCIDQADFDVLVVDIELRPGSGINVIRHARKHWTKAPLPLVIVLTNHTSATVKDLCMRAGADHFLDKMRQFDHLYPLIRDHQY
jgi:two-component system, OmpR family, response regulator